MDNFPESRLGPYGKGTLSGGFDSPWTCVSLEGKSLDYKSGGSYAFFKCDDLRGNRVL